MLSPSYNIWIQQVKTCKVTTLTKHIACTEELGTSLQSSISIIIFVCMSVLVHYFSSYYH